MESTSVYWIPVYETLERAGFEVMLVPPRMTKQIGGRKSDVLDCIRRRQHTLFAEPIDDPQADYSQPVPDGIAAAMQRHGAAGPA